MNSKLMNFPFLFNKSKKINPKLLAYPQEIDGKQVSYPTISTRIASASFDMLLIALLSYPLLFLINKIFAIDAETQKGVSAALLEVANNENKKVMLTFGDFFSISSLEKAGIPRNFILIQIVTQVAMFISSMVFILWFNLKYNTTPGKFLFKLYVLDEKTYKKPSKTQFVIRFFSYLLTLGLLLIPLLFAAFSLRKRALHDVIAGTVVVRLKKL